MQYGHCFISSKPLLFIVNITILLSALCIDGSEFFTTLATASIIMQLSILIFGTISLEETAIFQYLDKLLHLLLVLMTIAIKSYVTKNKLHG